MRAAGNPATKKRPAGASTKKRPAGASLPEAGHVQKKPAVAASPGAILPAAGHVQKRLVSASFGEVKATKASQKFYIQARATASDKRYCLVNIEGKAGWTTEGLWTNWLYLHRALACKRPTSPSHC